MPSDAPPVAARAGPAAAARVALFTVVSCSVLVIPPPLHMVAAGTLVVLLALAGMAAGRPIWLPARWELLAAVVCGVVATLAWGMPSATLMVVAALVVSGDLDAQRRSGSRWPVFMLAGAVVLCAGAAAMALLARAPARVAEGLAPSQMAGPALILAVAGSAAAGTLGYPVSRGPRLVLPLVLICIGFLFASTYSGPAAATAAAVGLLAAVVSLLATRRHLVARRWFRWMFAFGLVALASTWGLRLTSASVSDMGTLFGFPPGSTVPWWRVAVVVPCVLPALAAMVSLAARMRYFSERRSPVRASAAFAALAACTAGLLVQPGAPVPEAFPLLVLLCGGTGYADRPLHPAEAIQLESRHGPLRLYLRAFGMRKLRAVGIAFGPPGRGPATSR